MLTMLDTRSYFETEAHAPRCNEVTGRLSGSQILAIAAEIRALQATGREICNLTVGDYAPKEFPLHPELSSALQAAIARGENNYAPVIGLPEVRDIVADYYRERLGLDYPREAVMITAGARPVVYAFFRAVVARGDKVINPAPSWNIHHYATLAEAEMVVVQSKAEDRFLPTAEGLAPHLKGARALCLCSPSNPAGTLMDAEELGKICDLVLAENARRGPDERPLFVLYDQIYWPIRRAGEPHVNPVSLRPEMARYTCFVDGISKAFAATGIRVGWGLAPPDLIAGMGKYISHSGAWSPRPIQLGARDFLAKSEAVDEAIADVKTRIEARMDPLVAGLQAMKDAGLPVDFIPPAGGLYLTVAIDAIGKTRPDETKLKSIEDIRLYLLDAAGMGVVPFRAFGVDAARPWFRISVGAISPGAIGALLPRLEAALAALS